MLMDILMEALMSMDDETLDSVLESCNAEELEIISDALEAADSDIRGVNVTLWGRKFKLDTIFDRFDGEKVLPEQKVAANKFLRKNFIFDSKKNIEDYIKSESEGHISDVDNIFKYIMPNGIYVPRSNSREVAIMCDSKFDPEHGIAVVYENEKFKKIVPQDDIL